MLYLGLSKQYVESVFGIPVIEFTETSSNTIRAFYKQKHSVVSCSYADDHIVAFFVIVNVDKKIYIIIINQVRKIGKNIVRKREMSYTCKKERGE